MKKRKSNKSSLVQALLRTIKKRPKKSIKQKGRKKKKGKRKKKNI